MGEIPVWTQGFEGYCWLVAKQRMISISELRANFSKTLRTVERGWEVTITKHEVPIAKLVPIKQKRLGFAWGQVWIADDFDAPLPDGLLKEFYGGELPEIVEPPKKK